MRKHQLFTSEILVDDCEVIGSPLSDIDLANSIKEELVKGLVMEILKNKDLLKVTKSRDVANYSTTFKLSLVAVKPSDYTKLEDVIDLSNFIVMDEGYGVLLSELL